LQQRDQLTVDLVEGDGGSGRHGRSLNSDR
jgi:hypothetical protein